MPRKLTMWISLALLLAFGLAAAVPGQAIRVAPDDDNDLDDDPEDDLDDDDELELGADKTVFFERLIAAYPELAVTVEELQAMFDAGWGLGDLVICAVISVDSGKSFEDVLALAESGMGWGKAAKESGIEARNLGQAVSAAMGKKGLLWKGHEGELDESKSQSKGQGSSLGNSDSKANNKDGKTKK